MNFFQEPYSWSTPRYIAWSHGRSFFSSPAEPNNPHDSHIKWQQIYCGRRRRLRLWLRRRQKLRPQCQIERQWALDKKKRGHSGTVATVTFCCLSYRDPTLDSYVCVRVCEWVCCAFAALIPFNTNRIERSAISCDENINKNRKKRLKN